MDLDLKAVLDRGNYQNIKHSQREKFKKTATKLIKTTMIGALAAIESHFGPLWKHDSTLPLTEEEEILKQLYERARSQILDNGNAQIKKIDDELDRDTHTMVLPVKERHTN